MGKRISVGRANVYRAWDYRCTAEEMETTASKRKVPAETVMTTKTNRQRVRAALDQMLSAMR